MRSARARASGSRRRHWNSGLKYAKVPHFPRPISRLVLGSMALSSAEMTRSTELIEAFVAAGGNAIDTAHIYGPDKHKVVGEFLRANGRESLIVMDKGCHPYQQKRVTREDMASDIRESHERLGVGRTEFFVLHRDDPDVPAGEIIEWLNEHKAAGRIDGFGGSNWSCERIEAANRYAEEHGLQGMSLSSPNLALATPIEPMWAGAYSVTREDRDWFERTGFPLFSWSSGAGGFFAGLDTDNVKRVYVNESNLARRDRATELARRYGATPTQIAVAWTLNQPLNVFAIVGPKTAAEWAENLAALNLTLTPDELNYLEMGPS